MKQGALFEGNGLLDVLDPDPTYETSARIYRPSFRENKPKTGSSIISGTIIYTLKAVLRIWIRIRIHMFLGLPDPDPDPLVRGMASDPDPALDPDPDPSIIMQK